MPRSEYAANLALQRAQAPASKPTWLQPSRCVRKPKKGFLRRLFNR